MLQEENGQLRSKVESAHAQLSTVYSELENLKREVHNQIAKEEGLQLLVQKKNKEILEWKQTCDAQSQHLNAVAAFATVSGGRSAIVVYCASYEQAVAICPFKSTVI